MRVPLSWLAEWVDLPADVADLAERLTMAGLEVDEIEQSGTDLSSFRVGFVEKRAPHPNADRLSVCQVDLGEGELVQIVCGAPNVDAGQKVAVASPGNRLPDGTKLKKSKIRGEVSHGMICSASELGLGDDHDGILVLETEAAPGSPLDGVLTAGETVLEVAITANRGDCTSILGMAREVRALASGEPPIRIPEVAPDESGPSASDAVSVEIDDSSGCWAYHARVVRGVRVGESPDWLKARLEALEVRPINVVVDITNLVMFEFGQPIHAFDLAKVQGSRVVVRAARAGETLTTLDGVERKLVVEDLVIADADRSIALAGVMGGANSEVADDTTDLLIESAWFEPSRVRRTARRLGLASDASYRFEREVDREGVQRAADRAARLDGRARGWRGGGRRRVGVGSPPPPCEEIELGVEQLNGILGTALSASDVQAVLGRLDITPVGSGSKVLRCRIPSHRNDLSIPQDLVEEVARIHGYSQIPSTVESAPLLEGSRPVTWDAMEAIRDALVAAGLTEVMTFPFMPPGDLDALRLEQDDPRRQLVELLNPIVEANRTLRSSLVSTLLRNVQENASRQVDEQAVFEVARSFVRASAEGSLPVETPRVTIVLTRGADAGLWGKEPAELFFVAKGHAERLLAATELEAAITAGASEPFLHPEASCEIRFGDVLLGSVGELHPEVARHFEIERPCAIVDFDLSAALQVPKRVVQFREVSRHPSVRRDLAVLLDRDRRAGEIVEAIRKQAGALLTEVDVFDRYEGKGVPAGKVSLAFRLVFQRLDRTLTDAEVTKATDRVIKMLSHRFGGELR